LIMADRESGGSCEFITMLVRESIQMSHLRRMGLKL
jgi:hypothetical protein